MRVADSGVPRGVDSLGKCEGILVVSYSCGRDTWEGATVESTKRARCLRICANHQWIPQCHERIYAQWLNVDWHALRDGKHYMCASAEIGWSRRSDIEDISASVPSCTHHAQRTHLLSASYAIDSEGVWLVTVERDIIRTQFMVQ